jgi:hypothetical protein
VLFKSGSKLIFDEKSLSIQCCEEEGKNIRLDGLKWLLSDLTHHRSYADRNSEVSVCADEQPIGDVALSEIEGVHISAQNFLKNHFFLNRELLSLSEREVLDFLKVFPITLLQESGKNYCVTGIYSYLLAKKVFKEKRKLPVCWYDGRKGMSLRRLIAMELLAMPLAFSMNKSLLPHYFNSIEPTFSNLYNNSLLAKLSRKQFSARFGMDPRTLKGGGND